VDETVDSAVVPAIDLMFVAVMPETISMSSTVAPLANN
jgi:hypothetical protein